MTMSVVADAFQLPGDPIADILHHMDHGWVYTSPTSFGLARIVDVSWPQEDLMCPEVYVDPTGDLTDENLGWYFTRIAGDMAEVFSHLPFPLPYVGWHRHKGSPEPRIHDYDSFAARIRHAREIGFHAQ